MNIERFMSMHPAADLPKVMAALSRTPAPEGAPQNSWYRIEAKANGEAEVFLYAEIGGYGITPADFIHDLSKINAKNIALRINSPGGLVADGIAIFNAIKRHPCNFTSYIDGVAASTASFIALAADSVVMSPHSQMFIHDAHGLAVGNAATMTEMAAILNKASDNIAAIYAEKAGGTVEDWRARMREETWFSDQEAVDAGLADRIDGEDEEAVAARAEARVTASLAEEIADADIVDEDPIEDEPEPVDFGQLFTDIVEEDALLEAVA